MADAPTTTPAQGGTSKVTIAIVALIVIIVLGIGTYIYNKSSVMPSVASGGDTAGGGVAPTGGNGFVGGAAINKRQLSNYKAWQPGALETKTPSAEQKNTYGMYYSEVNSSFGNPEDNQSWVAGFLKGMNLAITDTNVRLFKNEIQQYLKNPNKLRHWEVDTAGQFLS